MAKDKINKNPKNQLKAIELYNFYYNTLKIVSFDNFKNSNITRRQMAKAFSLKVCEQFMSERDILIRLMGVQTTIYDWQEVSKYINNIKENED